MSRLIGLTGPPGSGKSSVLEWMSKRGVEVIDADAAVAVVLSDDQRVISRVGARFGGVVNDGVVDRAALADIVFTDSSALSDLEAMVHPAVTLRIKAWEKGLADTVGVVEAIKLTDSDLVSLCEAVWLVTCDRGVRLGRLAGRGWPAAEAERRTRAAPPLLPQLAAAAEVIDNSGPWSHTERQLEAAWARFESGGGR